MAARQVTEGAAPGRYNPAMLPRTTISCTVGPACESPDVLRGVLEAGARLFRINGVMAGEAGIAPWVERVHEAAASVGVVAGVLLDLPGPKIRVGAIAGAGRFDIRPGMKLRVDALPAPSEGDRIPVRSVQAIGGLTRGSAILLGDGRERLEVLGADPQGLDVRVVDGGEVHTGMGIHFPGFTLPTAVPTREDRSLLAAGIEAGVDMVAQSFLRNEDDLARLKEALTGLRARHVLAVAKVERQEAVDRLDRIVERADALIVARGDLAMNIGVERVPSVQRRVLEAGRRAARPVIIATEMLDSMTHSARPTRAEASDVAGAVFEAADGVMLSGETAVGDHPAIVVATMARILRAAEADPTAPHAGDPLLRPLEHKPGRPDQHVVRAAVDLARDTGAAAILVFTREGSSALRLSKERPVARIHAFTRHEAVARRLSIAWGVESALLHNGQDKNEILEQVLDQLREQGALRPGDRAVLVMGSPRDPVGATSLIQLVTA